MRGYAGCTRSLLPRRRGRDGQANAAGHQRRSLSGQPERVHSSAAQAFRNGAQAAATPESLAVGIINAYVRLPAPTSTPGHSSTARQLPHQFIIGRSAYIRHFASGTHASGLNLHDADRTTTQGVVLPAQCPTNGEQHGEHLRCISGRVLSFSQAADLLVCSSRLSQTPLNQGLLIRGFSVRSRGGPPSDQRLCRFGGPAYYR